MRHGGMRSSDWRRNEPRFDMSVLLTFFLGLVTAAYIVTAL